MVSKFEIIQKETAKLKKIDQPKIFYFFAQPYEWYIEMEAEWCAKQRNEMFSYEKFYSKSNVK